MPRETNEPAADRPSPRAYFLPEDEGTGLLPWSSAVERLVVHLESIPPPMSARS